MKQFHLFPRIELEEELKKDYNENLKIENPITIDDFNKIEIKVVQIEKAEKIENADKLLKFHCKYREREEADYFWDCKMVSE